MTHTPNLDLHIYTNNTDGGNDKVSYLCETAAAKGLRAVAFTDLCDLAAFDPADSLRRIRHSFFDMLKAKKLFCESVLVLAGIEFANILFEPQQAAKILIKQEYDIVLTSITKLRCGKTVTPDSDETTVRDFTADYVSELLTVIDNTDFDVLSRLMLPYRDLTNIPSDLADAFIPVLTALSCKNAALEINTRDLMGSEKIRNIYFNIINEYRELGGTRITFGSESYFHDDVGNGLDLAMTTAARAGFNSVTLYEKRTPYELPIN